MPPSVLREIPPQYREPLTTRRICERESPQNPIGCRSGLLTDAVRPRRSIQQNPTTDRPDIQVFPSRCASKREARFPFSKTLSYHRSRGASRYVNRANVTLTSSMTTRARAHVWGWRTRILHTKSSHTSKNIVVLGRSLSSVAAGIELRFLWRESSSKYLDLAQEHALFLVDVSLPSARFFSNCSNRGFPNRYAKISEVSTCLRESFKFERVR